MHSARAFFSSEPAALVGALWIILWTVVAATSTLWRPDPTQYANDQHLEWSMLDPGASITATHPDGPPEERTFLLGTDRFGRD